MKNQMHFLWLSLILLTFSAQLFSQSIGKSSSSYYEFVPEDVTFIGVWRGVPKGKSQMILPPNKDFGKLQKIATSRGYNTISNLDVGFYKYHYSVWEKSGSSSRSERTYSDPRRSSRGGRGAYRGPKYVRELNWLAIQNLTKGRTKSSAKVKSRGRTYIKNIQITGKDIYTVTFAEGSIKQKVIRANNWNQFVAQWKKVRATNMRLRCVEYSRGQFVGVFDASKKGTYLYNFIGWKAFTKKWEELGKKNYRLVDIQTYKANGKMHYVGIWHYGKDGYYLWNVKGYYNFQKKFDELKKHGLHLVDLEVIMLDWQ